MPYPTPPETRQARWVAYALAIALFLLLFSSCGKVTYFRNAQVHTRSGVFTCNVLYPVLNEDRWECLAGSQDKIKVSIMRHNILKIIMKDSTNVD